jgi:hypothetical protein
MMKMEIIGYRSLSNSEIEEHRSKLRNSISRRGVLNGLISLPLLATTCLVPSSTVAQGQILAFVTFASALLEFGERAYAAYSTVTTHPKVINHTDEVENRALLGSVSDDRGLIIHQGYTVIWVPPRSAAIVRVSVSAGRDPGSRELIIQSRIDRTSGEFEVA